MGKCVHSAVINAPVDEVWQRLRNFHRPVSGPARSSHSSPLASKYDLCDIAKLNEVHPNIRIPRREWLVAGERTPLRFRGESSSFSSSAYFFDSPAVTYSPEKPWRTQEDSNLQPPAP
jgi:hypothetical protein